MGTQVEMHGMGQFQGKESVGVVYDAGAQSIYNGLVRRPAVRKYGSFEEADRADKAYYLSLTPDERLRIMCELCSLRIRSRNDPSPRLARVYRVIESPRS
jgi:hypothetical protein